MDHIPYVRHEAADSVWIQIDQDTQTAFLHFQAQDTAVLMVTIPLSALVTLRADIERELPQGQQQPARAKERS